jgi:hypothetical protein
MPFLKINGLAVLNMQDYPTVFSPEQVECDWVSWARQYAGSLPENWQGREAEGQMELGFCGREMPSFCIRN